MAPISYILYAAALSVPLYVWVRFARTPKGRR